MIVRYLQGVLAWTLVVILWFALFGWLEIEVVVNDEVYVISININDNLWDDDDE